MRAIGESKTFSMVSFVHLVRTELAMGSKFKSYKVEIFWLGCVMTRLEQAKQKVTVTSQ